MDVSPFLEPRIAPRAIFDDLESKRTRVRFMLPEGDGRWRGVTWGAFADQVRCAALALRGLGVEMGDRVAIFGANSLSWFVAAQAIEAMGAAMVPIYPSSTAQQAAYVLEHSDARAVFVSGAPCLSRVLEVFTDLAQVQSLVLLEDLDWRAVAQEMRVAGQSVPPEAFLEARVLHWGQLQGMGQAMHEEDNASFMRQMMSVSLEQTAVMLYTSGTTGQPKGVPLTHLNIAVNGADWLRCNGPALEEGMVDVLWLPMSHIFGFGEACLGNTLGFVSYLSDPYQAWAHIKEIRPDVLMSVPSMWEKMVREAMSLSDPVAQAASFEASTGGRLKFCLSGGAGLKPEIKTFYQSQGCLIIEGYGLTEASPTLTLNRPGDFRFDSVGKPLPSVELRLAPDGEILARGPSIFGGYHKNPAATAEVLTEDGWLKTGDLGRWTEDGFLQIVGRKKEILVTAGGKNISPANIELRFRDDPYLSHVVVFGDGQRYLVAGVWLHEDAVAAHLRRSADEASAEARRALVQERLSLVNASLARHETIKKFVILDEPLTVEGGMLTPTLKVKRRQVYARFGEAMEALYEG